MNLEHCTLAVVGLGYVGLPLAVEFGKLRRVIGYDINANRVAELTGGSDRTQECASNELQAARHLIYTCSASDLQEARIFIVTVPTPVDQANQPDMRPLIAASETIGSVLKVGDLVIYESTVYPGATEEVCVPVLEKSSGLKFNKDFFCGYSPERINPGDKSRRLSTIKKVTSGSNAEVAEAVDRLYAEIITAGTHRASSIRVAEASKVIENSQRDLNIAFVNELSVLFARLGIDTNEVLEAAGTKWNFMPFRPGLVGGHCISVDPYYLTHKAEQVGYYPQVIHAGRRINDNMGRHVAQHTIKLMLKNGMDVPRCTICVLGVTFKENCPDIRNSRVFDLIEEFTQWGATVIASDPWANSREVSESHGVSLLPIDSLNAVDALVLAVGHESYRKLTPRQLRNMCRGVDPVISDVKSLFSRDDLERAGFTVFRL